MKRLLFLLVLGGHLATAHADLIVEQQIESSKNPGKLVLKVKGEKIRLDSPAMLDGSAGPTSMIIDTTSGDLVLLAHKDKTAMKVSAEELRRLTGPKPGPKPGFVATGKIETVGAYTTEIYTLKVGSLKQTVWVARDYPNFNRLQPQIDLLAKTEHTALAAANVWQLPGMVVKNEQEFMGEKATITLLSVTDDSVDSALLKKPADYREEKAPKPPAPTVE